MSAPARLAHPGRRASARVGFAVLGLAALAAACAGAPHDAWTAVRQDWAPFVLVSGLLLMGLVAGGDGLFDAAGRLVARSAKNGVSLLAASAVLVAVVTAVLNLDTAVLFLTPVLVVAARNRRTDELPFLYLAVFLANGASLLLPGSNLTNLIVVSARGGHGSSFAATMALPWVAAVVTVPLVLALFFRRSLARSESDGIAVRRPPLGAGLAGVAVAVVAMLVLPAGPMALTVVGAGVLCVAWRSVQGRLTLPDVARTVDVGVLSGLFGLAVALGVLGRSWDGPSRLLHHANSWETAGIGALASVLVNNLPAASLLAARAPAHGYALLIGLDLGPNLAVTGALSAVLWLQAARAVGARPSLARFSRLGLVVVPLSMAAALGALALMT